MGAKSMSDTGIAAVQLVPSPAFTGARTSLSTLVLILLFKSCETPSTINVVIIPPLFVSAGLREWPATDLVTWAGDEVLQGGDSLRRV